MKKSFLISLVLILSLSLMSIACGGNEQTSTTPTNTSTTQTTQTTKTTTQAPQPVSYDLTNNDNLNVEGKTFDADVTVTGSNGTISFNNCVFNAKLINKGGEGARVFVNADSSFGKNAECIIDTSLKSATMETNLPRFMIFCEMPNIQCKEIGAVTTLGDITIKLNGKSYPVSSSEYFMNENTDEISQYTGQSANYHNLAMWVENGTSMLMHIATGVPEEDFGPAYYTLANNEYTEDGKTFNDDVIIEGTNGTVYFNNCVFNAKVINRGGEGVKVFINEDCSFGKDAECLIESTLTDATMDTNLPKFLILCDMPNVKCDKIGSVITYVDKTIKLNGKSYTVSSSEYFMNETTGEFAPYSGQKSDAHMIAMWIEGGNPVSMHIASAS